MKSRLESQEKPSSRFLVYWQGSQDESGEALPMRVFNTEIEAEAYISGCADVICIRSENELKVKDVTNDFLIMEAH